MLHCSNAKTEFLGQFSTISPIWSCAQLNLRPAEFRPIDLRSVDRSPEIVRPIDFAQKISLYW